MSDQKVLETQKWLNDTYKNVAGFEKAPLNGQTGWKTIYSLREALQHELGLTHLGEGFGDATKSALARVIAKIKPGYKGKIVKLIKGAFWCKGISSGLFTETYDVELDRSVKRLQGYAGLRQNGVLTVNLLAALFDMSAFVLVAGGDEKIRRMQQDLNARFSNELGVMPCDGIYQRDTNKALIYALQRTVGMSAKLANGNYGPGTIKATPTVSQRTTGYIVQIIQYGLYVNGFYHGNFDGKFNSGVVTGIINFRRFMNLPPFSALADLTLIKGLLTSNGNTNRDSNTCDASKQLTTTDIANFKRYGFSIVGRYLTGSVGVGKNKRPKNLTVAEIKRIAAGGLRLFPIYEDGGYEVAYFTSRQGSLDAQIASQAARKLGFPAGTTIYFAVDVDVQEGEIKAKIEPYISALVNVFKHNEYEVGLYGTRNVCLHGEKLGVKNSFVADMSYGWSGNLGFRMPRNWAFDQFSEYPIGGTPIDQDASSGRDKGVVITNFPKVISKDKVIADINKMIRVVKIEYGKKVTVPFGKMKLSMEVKTDIRPKDGGFLTIKNGKFDSASMAAWLKNVTHLDLKNIDVLIGQLNKISFVTKIEVGNITMENSFKLNGTLTTSVTFEIQKYEGQYLDEAIDLIFSLDISPTSFRNFNLKKELLNIKEVLEVVGFIIIVVAIGFIMVSLSPEISVETVVTSVLVALGLSVK